MKALTIRQPWATMVGLGAKQYETRSWSTSYRGPLAIHAAKGFRTLALDLCWTPPFRGELAAVVEHPRDLPFGAVIATAWLGGVRSTDDPGLGVWISEQERAFGDYSPGRYAWMLFNVEPLAKPIPAKGALGLWEWKA